MSAPDRSETILALLRGELTSEEAAERHGVDVAEVESWKQRFVEAGERAVEPPDPPSRTRAPPTPAPRARAPRNIKRLLLVAAVVAAVAVAAGGAFVLWRVRAGAPSDDARACDDAIVALLQRSKQPMRILLYLSPDIAPVARAAAELETLLGDYAERAQGKLLFERVEVKTEQDRARAKELGLQETGFGTVDSGSAVIGLGYFGLVFEYGSEKDVIPLLSPDNMRGMQFWIGNKVRELRSRADDESQKIAILTTTGGVSPRDPDLIPPQVGRPGPSLIGIVEQALPFYRLIDAPPGEAVPEEARALLITQPGEPLDELTRRAVDAFLMRGDRALVVVAGAASLKAGDATMRASLDLHGVDALLEPYGIEVRRDVLLDPAEGASVSIPADKGDGNITMLAAHGVLRATHDADAPAESQRLDAGFAGFFRINEVVFPFASSLLPHAERQPGARFRVVARSSPGAVRSEGTEIALAPGSVAPSGEAAQQAIAIAVQGTLKSAFGEQSAEARLLVISASQFLANPFARAGNPTADGGGDAALQAIAAAYAREHLTVTILTFKNVLDWATADEALLSCSALLLQPD